MNIQSRFAWAFAFLALAVVVGCAGGQFAQPQSASIQITNTSAAVRAGDLQQFAATVSGTKNNSVVWSVKSVEAGSIDSNGLYKAPTTIPEQNVIEINAALADGSASARTSVTLLNPIPVVESAVEQTSAARGLSIVGKNFVPGATAIVDGSSVPTTFISSTSLSASAVISVAKQNVEISVANPDPGAANSGLFTVVGRPTRPSRSSYSNGAARFLDQASFGPTPAEIANVQTFPGGMSAYIDNQFTLPASSWTVPTLIPQVTINNNTLNLCFPDNLVSCLQILWFQNALTGQDQLRQRTAFALSQIWVISANVVFISDSYQTYYGILNTDAFSTYDNIIRDVTKSSAMGYYLDMGNSPKPVAGQIANENYARELLQLFTVGLYLLNDDGTYQLDANGQPLPAYSENDIQQIAKALTGWTYQANGTQLFPQTFTSVNGTNRTASMIIYNNGSQHDTSAKTCDLLSCSMPAGQTAQQDLDGVVQAVFNHTNVPPFISKQLIQHLVTSNPSPAYVARISSVFKNNGTGVRGDMKAVIKAILLDPEAREGDAYSSNDNSGHLREPVLFITGIVRGLGSITGNVTTFTAGNGSGSMTNLAAPLVGIASNMGQDVLFAPSVFNYFPPDNVIPGTNNLGPEFLLFTTATSPQRLNFVDNVIRNIYTYTGIDFAGSLTGPTATYVALAATPDVLVNRLDQIFTHGQMSASTKQSIVTAISALPTGTTANDQFRAKRAVYLVLSSSQYQVSH
jgi:uncharacterized protein (DUF1800 family)